MASLAIVLAGTDTKDAEPDYKRLGELADITTAKAKQERLEILRRNPALASRIGDVARHVEGKLIDDLGSGLLAEAVPEKCRAMRRELGYKDASELERLLFDRIVLTWLHVQRAELDRNSLENGATLVKCTFYRKEASRVLVDHTRALLALARVRRLLRPTVTQVNIAAAGGQQVNQIVGS